MKLYYIQDNNNCSWNFAVMATSVNDAFDMLENYMGNNKFSIERYSITEVEGGLVPVTSDTDECLSSFL